MHQTSTHTHTHITHVTMHLQWNNVISRSKTFSYCIKWSIQPVHTWTICFESLHLAMHICFRLWCNKMQQQMHKRMAQSENGPSFSFVPTNSFDSILTHSNWMQWNHCEKVWTIRCAQWTKTKQYEPETCSVHLQNLQMLQIFQTVWTTLGFHTYIYIAYRCVKCQS